MKVRILCISAVLILSLAACKGSDPAAPQATDGKAPAAAKQEGNPTMDMAETTFDFGEITQGTKIEHVYKFKNNGTADLKLGRPKTSCGCTASLLSKDIIPPGSEGEIKVTFNSSGKRGKQNRRITIPSNVPGMEKVQITITGEVKVDLAFEPNYVKLGTMTEKKAVTKIVKLTNTGETAVTITKVEVSRSEEVKVDLKEGTELKPGASIEFKATVKPKEPMRHFSSRLQIQTSHAKQNRLYLALYGQVANKKGELPPPPKGATSGRPVKRMGVTKGKGGAAKVMPKAKNLKPVKLNTKVAPKASK